MKTNHLLNKMIFQIAFGLIMVEIAGAITYMIDGIVTSRFLDATAMAANGVAVPVYSVLTIISGVLATGFQNIAGKQIGEGDIEKARNTWETTWHFALIISCVITLAGIFFSDGVATLLGAPVSAIELHTDSSELIKGYMIGTVPYILIALFVPALQFNGNNKLITVSIVAMTVADVVGDLLNVYLFNGGVFGMGLATSLSYFISAAILMTGLLNKNTLMRISIRSHISKEKGTLLSIIYRGLPKATKRACNSLRSIIVNRLIVAMAGEIAMVAMSVECTIRYIPESIGVGLSGAALMLVGIFLGEMDYHSLKEMQKTYRVLIGVGVTLLSVIYFIASDFLTQLYITPGSPSYQLTVNILRCHAVSLPFLAYNECCLSCLQAMGKMLVTHILTVIQRIVCIIGLSYFLGFFFGVDGIWYAIPLSEVIVAVIIVFCSKVIVPSRKKNEPDVIGDFSESLTEINQISNFLDRVGDFLKRYDIDKQKSYYVYLFCEEISNLVLQKGFNDKKAHHLDIRVIYTENEITVRTRDDCLNLSDIEKYDKCPDAPDDSLLGFHMVFKLAKKVEYIDTMNLNHLIIRL